jgi:hypothetical protein
MLASTYGHTEVVRQLLHNRGSALDGRAQVVQLLQSNASASLRNNEGLTALELAAKVTRLYSRARCYIMCRSSLPDLSFGQCSVFLLYSWLNERVVHAPFFVFSSLGGTMPCGC